MSTIGSRVARLEHRMGAGQGKLVVISAGLDDAGVDALLTQHGLDQDDPTSLIVTLHRFAADRPKPELLYTMPLR